MATHSVVLAPRQRGAEPNWLTALAIVAVLCTCQVTAVAQVNVLTQHNDNLRSGLNGSEVILSPATVNGATFGPIASLPVDGLIAAEPLYMSGVNIAGQGIHNVVFAVTLHDSVYAFDADGHNPNPLWHVSFLNPAAGITTEPSSELGCGTTTFFSEMGILGTPVIDPVSQTIYVVAKTKENGSYHFRLHALDVGAGTEKSGSPVDINGSVTGTLGTLMLNGAAQNMMARPGLLLTQGTVYVAFGSNGCDSANTRGWVVGYDATTLSQVGVFNDTPNTKQARGNIWQAGSGLASDDNGNIFFATANGGFDTLSDYGSSILKIGRGTSGGLVVNDYFTPYNQAYLSANDLDVGSAGVMLLPDQPGPHTHLLVGSGKEGSIYLLDRDNMGQYNPVDNSRIAQFIPFASSRIGRMFSTAAYWNGYVYFTGQVAGVAQYSLNNGQLLLQNQNPVALCCPGTPSISANGSAHGILWTINGAGFEAFDAANVSSPALYSLTKLGTPAHFATPMVANGRVYVGSSLSLQVLGLLGHLQTMSGDNQSAPALGKLPLPLTVAATDPYTGAPVAGVTVTFSDNKKGGVFNPATAVTDASGRASTSYTVPKIAGTYPVTATYPASAIDKFTVTVVGGNPATIKAFSGNRQVGPMLATLPLPLVAQVLDAYNNGVAGQPVSFTDGGKGGTFSAPSTVSDASGLAQTYYTSGTKSGTISFTITSGSLHQGMSATIQPGPAVRATTISGSNQRGVARTTLPALLVAKVLDQYGNGIPGVSVTYSDGGVGGSFSVSTVTTDLVGRAIVTYKLPPTPQVVHITATDPGVGAASFTETAQ